MDIELRAYRTENGYKYYLTQDVSDSMAHKYKVMENISRAELLELYKKIKGELGL
jgi:ribose 1,5-bisphosphokinase PhnN